MFAYTFFVLTQNLNEVVLDSQFSGANPPLRVSVMYFLELL